MFWTVAHQMRTTNIFIGVLARARQFMGGVGGLDEGSADRCPYIGHKSSWILYTLHIKVSSYDTTYQFSTQRLIDQYEGIKIGPEQSKHP